MIYPAGTGAPASVRKDRIAPFAASGRSTQGRWPTPGARRGGRRGCGPPAPGPGTSAPPGAPASARGPRRAVSGAGRFLLRRSAHHPRPGRPAPPLRLDDGRRVRLVHPGAVVRPEDVGQPAAHALDGVVDPPRRGRRQRVAGPVRRRRRRQPGRGGRPGRMVEDQLRGDARPQGVASTCARSMPSASSRAAASPAMSPNP